MITFFKIYFYLSLTIIEIKIIKLCKQIFKLIKFLYIQYKLIHMKINKILHFMR